MASGRVWGWDLQPIFRWYLAKWSERLIFSFKATLTLGCKLSDETHLKPATILGQGWSSSRFGCHHFLLLGLGKPWQSRPSHPAQSFRQGWEWPPLTDPFTASSACIFATLCAAVCGSKEDRRHGDLFTLDNLTFDIRSVPDPVFFLNKRKEFTSNPKI